MAFHKVANNAIGTISNNPLGVGETNLVVNTALDVKLNAIGAFPFYLTIWDSSLTPDTDPNMEIVNVTARPSANNYTIQRAQQSTLDVVHEYGSSIGLLWTKGNVDEAIPNYTPARGKIYFVDANELPALLSPGTSGQFLMSNGSGADPVFMTIPSGSNPTGVIIMFGGSSAPTGYLICDGSAVSRSTYSSLFSVLGTTYGAGDGSTTFNLPDLRGRVPVGVGTGTGGGASGSGAPTGGSALTARARGDWLGEETHVLTTTEMPAHTHTVRSAGGGGGQRYIIPASSGDSPTTIDSGSAGSDGAHNNIQPVMTVNFIIKT